MIGAEPERTKRDIMELPFFLCRDKKKPCGHASAVTLCVIVTIQIRINFNAISMHFPPCKNLPSVLSLIAFQLISLHYI